MEKASEITIVCKKVQEHKFDREAVSVKSEKMSTLIQNSS